MLMKRTWALLSVAALLAIGVGINSIGDDTAVISSDGDAPVTADGGLVATGPIELVNHEYGGGDGCDTAADLADPAITGGLANDHPLCFDGNDTPVTDCDAIGGTLIGTGSGSTGMSDGSVTVTNSGSGPEFKYINVIPGNGFTIEWTHVKGGSTYNHYVGDLVGLHGPENNGGNLPDISHYWVCYTAI